MKSFIIAILFITGILAAPLLNIKAIKSLLYPSSLNSNPQCYFINILNIANLDY